MSPSLSPTKPRCSGDLLSESTQDSPRNRDTDISLSSAGEDEDECYLSSPNDTPNSSPSKNDLLSISPLQQRLARARNKRQQILEERVQQIFLKSTLKEAEALKRKEDVTLEKIEKARTELAKSPIAKERRDQQLALRIQSVEAALEYKMALAHQRHERNLFEKQQRACCKERKERAERSRKLKSYEKRAMLLAGDAKLERAALKSHKFNEEKSIRAGEDILKAKEVARRVKAARVIQGAVREAYGLESPDRGNLNLGQHDAAERLQRWSQWRAHICKRRLFVLEDNADCDATPKAIKALENLLELFPLAPQGKQHCPPSMTHQQPIFEHTSQTLMQPETLKMATVIVDCLRPINEVSFGSLEGSAVTGPSSKSIPKIDGRTLLSLSLIAVHPREVLGDDFDKPASNSEGVDDDRFNRGSRLLASSSQLLLHHLHELLRSDSDSEQIRIFKHISSLLLQTLTLFHWWKKSDITQLVTGLSKQLEQSWVVYLTSAETLTYLADVSGVENVANGPSKKDDPLMSLRLRHEAGRSGSRSHIKRIRQSLNKLIGAEEGKEVVKNAKMVALKDIKETNAMNGLKGEIDEIYGGLRSIMTPALFGANSVTTNTSDATKTDEGVPVQVNEQLEMPVDLPDDILSNRNLVHKILLTDPSDFDTLSWDGTNAHASNVAPEEFMASFIHTVSYEQRNDATRSMEDMPMHIAQSMRLAFFDQIAQAMGQENYESIHELLKELHTKMRSLLPSRTDLHSYINDEDVSSSSTTSDIFHVLIRAGYLLANYLESEARAPTTRELIECLKAFGSPRDGDDLVIPYGIESEEMFAVASTAYILHKAELTSKDVSNYKLSQAAPILHLVGCEYERKHFQKTQGDYSSSTIKEMQHMLPSTWNWVKKMHSLLGNSESLTTQSNFEQKMDFVKGRGFVDGILFTRNQLAMPEVLLLDVESINHIRSEARCCVIASALALHACNISKVGTSVLSSNVMTNEVNNARQALASVLRKRHSEQHELESNVIEAIGALTKALAERDLTEEELEALNNHTLAVLQGSDPVLKLLDNRVQSFFRFACKWKADAVTSGISAPLEMKTGKSILKTDDDSATRQVIKSTQEEFLLAAKKETLRLGFAYFGSDLIEVGKKARNIVSLACTNYGQDILERLMHAAWEEN